MAVNRDHMTRTPDQVIQSLLLIGDQEGVVSFVMSWAVARKERAAARERPS